MRALLYSLTDLPSETLWGIKLGRREEKKGEVLIVIVQLVQPPCVYNLSPSIQNTITGLVEEKRSHCLVQPCRRSLSYCLWHVLIQSYNVQGLNVFTVDRIWSSVSALTTNSSVLVYLPAHVMQTIHRPPVHTKVDAIANEKSSVPARYRSGLHTLQCCR